jgi:hypothetical protein
VPAVDEWANVKLRKAFTVWSFHRGISDVGKLAALRLPNRSNRRELFNSMFYSSVYKALT